MFKETSQGTDLQESQSPSDAETEHPRKPSRGKGLLLAHSFRGSSPSSLLWACGSQSIIVRGWVKRSCSPLRSQEAEARIRRFWEQTQPSRAYSLLPPTSPAPWSLTHPPVNSPIDELANEVSTLMTRSPLNSATDRTPSLQHMNL